MPVEDIFCAIAETLFEVLEEGLGAISEDSGEPPEEAVGDGESVSDAAPDGEEG